jgi:hypothetical protein
MLPDPDQVFMMRKGVVSGRMTTGGLTPEKNLAQGLVRNLTWREFMIIMHLIPIRKTTLHEDPVCALQRTSQHHEQLNRYQTTAAIKTDRSQSQGSGD